ncbi:MAG: sigma-70 family RNA polymerase sigma factor [Hespellia sp.]|nr:sigma-70 family RNA polymerase sigma factor [Hespellia sp.]
MLLIKRAQRHDTDAFIQLIEEHKTALYKVAKSYLKNEEDIADAIQDTIFSAYEHIEDLKTASYFKTWITRILINQCTDIIRQQKRFVTIEKATEPNGTYMESDYEFYELLGELPEKDRVIFLLYYGEGFNMREISEVLECNENTVRSKLQRGRKKLKQVLSY